MGSKLSLRDIFGLIKDKASLSRATILSKPSIHLTILRATTHSPIPPSDHQLSPLLHADKSRATSSDITTALINRLRQTGNCIVALKSLIIIHHVIKQGSFSLFPSSRGFNYLKLSNFRDRSTAKTLLLSSWVRWYAMYLDTILSTSRVLGYFFCSSSSSAVAEKNHELRMSYSLNADLVKDFESIVVLMEEICKVPDMCQIEGNLLVTEIISLLINDYLSAVHVALTRLGELKQRLKSLSFNDSVELTCSLKRLQYCKECLSDFYVIKKPSIEMLWGLVEELKDEIGTLKVNGEGRRIVNFGSQRVKMSESARFDWKVVKTGDSVQFHSGRFDWDKYSRFSVVINP